MNAAPLLDARRLGVTLGSGSRSARIVHDCSLQIHRGEVLALVGESGSGKTTLARAIAGILPISGGQLMFRDRDLATTRGSERRALRRRIQMVFQDPDSSLDPMYRVGEILTEPLQVIGNRRGDAVRARIHELLAMVRLDAALLGRRPRELSGGQKQRVAIARALAMEPELLIADEPLSSLDVSTQAMIADLFRDLQRRLGIGLLFISHDLSIVRTLADRVAVMYAGEIVETGAAREVLAKPAHPYTRLLLAATPDLRRRSLDLRLAERIDGHPAMPDEPGACGYRHKCLRREAACRTAPGLDPVDGNNGHFARCHFKNDPDPSPPVTRRT